MKTEIEFDNELDLVQFTKLLKRYHDQLEEIEYNYCCDDNIYLDMAIVDSVYQQLKFEVENGN